MLIHWNDAAGRNIGDVISLIEETAANVPEVR